MAIKQFINGLSFDSLKDACDYYDVNNSSVRGRVKDKCVTYEEAINYFRSKKRDDVDIYGLVFRSIPEACEYFDINYGSVHSKAKRSGISLKEALIYFLSKKTKESEEVLILNMFFNDRREACRYFGVNIPSVYRKMRKENISFEESILYYIKLKGENSDGVTINKHQFKNYSDACRFYNVDYALVRQKVFSEKVSYEEAINYFIKPVIVDGVLKKSIWNKRVKGLKIVSYLGKDMYKCDNNGVVRYYTKDELLRKYEELDV